MSRRLLGSRMGRRKELGANFHYQKKGGRRRRNFPNFRQKEIRHIGSIHIGKGVIQGSHFSRRVKKERRK